MQSNLLVLQFAASTLHYCDLLVLQFAASTLHYCDLRLEEQRVNH